MIKPLILSILSGLLVCLVSGEGRCQQERAEALRAELTELLQDKVADCDRLNPPYFDAKRLESRFPLLARPLEDMFIHRKLHDCLVYKCRPDRPCKAPPSITLEKNLEARFEEDRQALQDCWADADCPEARTSELSEGLRDIILLLLRDYKNRDRKRALELLDQVTIVVGPSEVVNRCAQVVISGKLTPEQATSVLRSMVEYVKVYGISRDAAIELIQLLEQLRRSERLPRDTRSKLLSAISRVLQAWLDRQSARELEALATDLGSVEQTERLLLLVRVARELKDPTKTADLAAAVRLILRAHPELRTEMNRELDQTHAAQPDLREQLVALARIMNGAQLAELNRLREAAAAWTLIHSSNRPLKILIAQRFGAASGEQRRAVQRAMAEEFAEQMRGLSPQSGDSIEVPGRSAQEIIAFAADALAGLVQPGDSVSTSCDRKQYGELCNFPYVGVYVLEEVDVPGRSDVCFTVGYAARTVDSQVRVHDPGTSAFCAADEADAVSKARDLAVTALRASTVDRYVQVWQKAGCPPQLEPPRHWWRDSWVRPAAWTAGVLTLVTGVYVSNAHPQSSSGDWIWRGGLALSAATVGLELANWRF